MLQQRPVYIFAGYIQKNWEHQGRIPEFFFKNGKSNEWVIGLPDTGRVDANEFSGEYDHSDLIAKYEWKIL